MGSSIKKIYTSDFKVKVVKYAKSQKNIAKAAREFGVSYSAVKRWINDFDNSNEMKKFS